MASTTEKPAAGPAQQPWGEHKDLVWTGGDTGSGNTADSMQVWILI